MFWKTLKGNIHLADFGKYLFFWLNLKEMKGHTETVFQKVVPDLLDAHLIMI